MLDARRFARLAAAEWVERRRGWAWFLGALVMIHFAIVLIVFASPGGFRNFTTNDQAAVFFSGLFVTAPVFAARYFQDMARPGPALLALMRPASAFEKWLLAGLVVAVAYPLAYHLVFYACDLPAALIAQRQAADALAALSLARPDSPEWFLRESLQSRHFRLFSLPATDLGAGGYLTISLMMATLMGFAVTGSLLFRRMSALKTVLAAFLVVLVLTLVGAIFDGEVDFLLEYWSHLEDTEDKLTAAQRVVFPFVWFAVPTLLWLAAWLALREREIA